MSLASAMSTALTGLNASETQIDVIGNNLANANTVGFKASDVLFATQFLQTQSVGSSPTATNGGTNPQQQGLGVEVAEITPNFSQGTISTANSPTDLAIQGDGFFIVQGQNGEQNYTRNGTFTTNAENQLVTGTGNRVMGYGVNNQFQIDTSQLQPLQHPRGHRHGGQGHDEGHHARLADARRHDRQYGLDHPDGPAHRREHDLSPDAAPRRPWPSTDRHARGRQPQRHVPVLRDLLPTATTRKAGRNSWRPPRRSLTNNQVTLSNFPTDTSGDMDVGADLSQHERSAGRHEFLPSRRHADSRPPAGQLHLHRQRHRSHRSAPSRRQVLNFNGPPATSNTLLTNVVDYDSTTGTYQNVFPTHGHFEFHGNQGRQYADRADLHRHATPRRSRTWRISCKARSASSRPRATIRTTRFPSIPSPACRRA